MKGIILSGMRPTGRLHIGHLSVLENWVSLQEDYESYFTVADWHALTTGFDATNQIKQNIKEMVLDWLAAGIDPVKSPLFIQSQVKQHAELHLLLSMIAPLPWLERCPTYKDQINQMGKQGKDIMTYGFLGYPLLQAADILAYQATAVPVGEDQLPHLELAREIGRRFNFLFDTKIMSEPQALLAKFPSVPGTDGRKMSKSYNNFISMSADEKELKKLVNAMVTDPARIHKTDKGNPKAAGCIVYKYHEIYNQENASELEQACMNATIGCGECKKICLVKLETIIAPIREKRAAFAAENGLVEDILADGGNRARLKAEATMEQVRAAMKIDF